VPGTTPTLNQLMPTRASWVVPTMAALVVVALALGGTALYLAMNRGDGASPTTAATDEDTEPAAPVVEAPPAKIWPEPLASNINLTVKILEQKCFGSAGCNVTYTIQAAYSGPSLEPGKPWDITYEVSGGDDPQINTLIIRGIDNGYQTEAQREERISTPKSSSKLTAKVTAVSRH
jgi:hypothetical protein